MGFPKGKVKEKECVIEAAAREVQEEGEVCCRVIQPFGRLCYKEKDEVVRARIYLMEMLFTTHPVESRQKQWMTFDGLIADQSIYPDIRELIKLASAIFGRQAGARNYIKRACAESLLCIRHSGVKALAQLKLLQASLVVSSQTV